MKEIKLGLGEKIEFGATTDIYNWFKTKSIMEFSIPKIELSIQSVAGKDIIDDIDRSLAFWLRVEEDKDFKHIAARAILQFQNLRRKLTK